MEEFDPLVWLLTNIVGTGILVFLIQLAFEERMKRRLIEFETRLSGSHQRQVEVVGELYKRLVVVRSNLNAYVTLELRDKPKEEKEKKVKELGEAVGAFTRYFAENRIYLPKPLDDKVSEYCASILVAFRSLVLVEPMRFAVWLGEQFPIDDERQEEAVQLLEQSKEEAGQELFGKTERLTDEIEREFRRLLGQRPKERGAGIVRRFRRSVWRWWMGRRLRGQFWKEDTE